MTYRPATHFDRTPIGRADPTEFWKCEDIPFFMAKQSSHSFFRDTIKLVAVGFGLMALGVTIGIAGVALGGSAAFWQAKAYSAGQ